MKRAATFALVGIAQVAGAGIDHVPVHSCGETYYGEYHPRVPTTIDEVAPVARGRIVAHLRARLGEEIAVRTALVGGQIVDRDALRRENPSSVNYQWHVPKYNLQFRVPLNSEGICVSLNVDEDGTIVEDLALPDFEKHPGRRSVISGAAATEIARTKGVPKGAMRDFAYFRDSDSLEWIFTFVASQQGANVRLKSLHIPAHDPKRTHWTESLAMR